MRTGKGFFFSTQSEAETEFRMKGEKGTKVEVDFLVTFTYFKINFY
jgi:hypothetical protein